MAHKLSFFDIGIEYLVEKGGRYVVDRGEGHTVREIYCRDGLYSAHMRRRHGHQQIHRAQGCDGAAECHRSRSLPKGQRGA